MIAIHNFPEGLATFAAAVQDPAAGVVFAIAVGGKTSFHFVQSFDNNCF